MHRSERSVCQDQSDVALAPNPIPSVSIMAISEPLVEVREDPSTTVLVLSGRIHVGNVHSLLEAAIDALEASRPVEVDCRALEGLDCAALQVLAALAFGLAQRGAEVRLSGLSPALDKLLRLAGMDGWMQWQSPVAPRMESGT